MVTERHRAHIKKVQMSYRLIIIVLLAFSNTVVLGQQSQSISSLIEEINIVIENIETEKLAIRSNVRLLEGSVSTIILTTEKETIKNGKIEIVNYQVNLALLDKNKLKRNINKKEMSLELKSTSKNLILEIQEDKAKYVAKMNLICSDIDVLRELEKTVKELIVIGHSLWKDSLSEDQNLVNTIKLIEQYSGSLNYSNEIVIDVVNGPSTAVASNNENTTVNAANKQALNINNNTFAFIKTNANLQPMASNNFFKSTPFWSLLLAPFLAIPIAILVRRKKEEIDADVQGNRIRKANRLAKKFLGKAKKALGQKEEFYVALEKALHNYLKAKLNIETNELSKDRINELLTNRKVNEETTSHFLNLLESCELARYSPYTQVEMQRDYDKSAETISLIDKQIR